MTLRTLRRRVRNRMVGPDWLEWTTTVLGGLFLVIAAMCVVGVVVSIATLGDDDPAFKTSPGFLQATRGFGVVLLGVFALLAAGVGWFLAGETIRRAAGRVLGRR